MGAEPKSFGSALFAVKKIALVDPPGMVERLRLWLAAGQPDLRRASQLAIRGLFDGAGRRAPESAVRRSSGSSGLSSRTAAKEARSRKLCSQPWRSGWTSPWPRRLC